MADYARCLDTLDKQVRLRAGGELVEGEAVRVEDDGALVVETGARMRTVRYGDVLSFS